MLCKVFRNIILAFLLAALNTEASRLYKGILARRCSNDDALLGSLSANQLACAVACLQTANCNSFNYYHSSNSVSLNCELLMTSETDYGALLSDADWSIYSSHDLIVSGKARFEDKEKNVILSCFYLPSSFLVHTVHMFLRYFPTV